MANRYSVYERGTDRPICIHGTSDECAKALGICRNTFYRQLNRQHNGQPPKKYEIFEDGHHTKEDEEDEMDLH